MSLKQFADSPWMRRLGRLATVFGIPTLGILVSGMLVFIAWNVAISYGAQETANKAVDIAVEVKDVQDERAELSDQRAKDEQAWRERFDRSLSSVNTRITTLIDQVGQLKGIVIREGNAEAPWLPDRRPAELLSTGQLDVARNVSEEDR